MKITDIINEHSDWPRDPTFTEADMLQIKKACIAIHNYAKEKGIELTFGKHFFDQIDRKRGFGKITAEMLIRTCARILNRGLHLMSNKDLGFSLVYFDEENGLNIPFIKNADDRFTIPTIVRDLKWYGREQKVKI